MSTFIDTNMWVISRRKLQQAGSDESGDTLRRSVLIHNIIKQHSLPPSPIAYQHPHHHQQEHYHEQHYQQPEEVEMEVEEVSAPQSNSMFVFPTIEDHPSYEPASAAGEQDWLDGLLNDLDEDVHVSVVPIDELDDEAVGASDPSYTSSPSANFSLFPPSTCPPSSQHQPESQYTYEALQPDTLRSLFYELGDNGDPASPPTSPPGLMEHNIDSDDDEDEWDPMCSTPSASTDCLGAGQRVPQPSQGPEYFFHMPFQRHRPALASHHFIMH